MTGAGSDGRAADGPAGSDDEDGTDGPADRTDTDGPADDGEDGGARPDGPPEEGPAAIHDRVRERAEAIAERERAAAIRKLEAEGEVTDRQREVVAEMTRGIVDGLMAAPEATLREADDRDKLRAALRLFGSEED